METQDLKEYVDNMHEADIRYRERMEKVLDYRLDGMNELREQIKDERAHFVSNASFDDKYKALETRHDRDMTVVTTKHEVDMDRIEVALQTILEWKANLTGRMVVFSILSLVIVGSMSALVSHLLGN